MLKMNAQEMLRTRAATVNRGADLRASSVIRAMPAADVTRTATVAVITVLVTMATAMALPPPPSSVAVG
ncbi:hypothetical protein [Candidatus Spongiihabitans sp.]|uniref:hypothetical protein n=1 Tax=Candidatus Spongiihabitans sp. TaxID=3101308 RepID=UPI003C7E55DE